MAAATAVGAGSQAEEPAPRLTVQRPDEGETAGRGGTGLLHGESVDRGAAGEDALGDRALGSASATIHRPREGKPVLVGGRREADGRRLGERGERLGHRSGEHEGAVRRRVAAGG